MIINNEWLGEIHSAIRVTIKQAKKARDVVQFGFSGVTVQVGGDSNPNLIYRDWNRGIMGYLGEKPTVQPYPAEVLSEEELASDSAIEAKNEKRRHESDCAYKKQQRQAKAFLEGVLLVAGPMELAHDKADEWADVLESNAADPYSKATCDYAETWARVMQARMTAGKTLEETAHESSRVADVDGITGFMYGCAVSMLSRCWIHGEQLRRWHNKNTQIGDEGDKANESGGVLNPALLCIG